jgi:hypothetical protein
MTQHFFTTRFNEKNTTVLLGWDHSLYGYFMSVFYLTGQGLAGHECLYSHLLDPNLIDGLSSSLEYFKSRLTELGVDIPTCIFSEVEVDEGCDSPKRLVFYWIEDGLVHVEEDDLTLQLKIDG